MPARVMLGRARLWGAWRKCRGAVTLDRGICGKKRATRRPMTRRVADNAVASRSCHESVSAEGRKIHFAGGVQPIIRFGDAYFEAACTIDVTRTEALV